MCSFVAHNPIGSGGIGVWSSRDSPYLTEHCHPSGLFTRGKEKMEKKRKDREKAKYEYIEQSDGQGFLVELEDEEENENENDM